MGDVVFRQVGHFHTHPQMGPQVADLGMTKQYSQEYVNLANLGNLPDQFVDLNLHVVIGKISVNDGMNCV